MPYKTVTSVVSKPVYNTTKYRNATDASRHNALTWKKQTVSKKVWYDAPVPAPAPVPKVTTVPKKKTSVTTSSSKKSVPVLGPVFVPLPKPLPTSPVPDTPVPYAPKTWEKIGLPSPVVPKSSPPPPRVTPPVIAPPVAKPSSGESARKKSSPTISPPPVPPFDMTSFEKALYVKGGTNITTATNLYNARKAAPKVSPEGSKSLLYTQPSVKQQVDSFVEPLKSKTPLKTEDDYNTVIKRLEQFKEVRTSPIVQKFATKLINVLEVKKPRTFNKQQGVQAVYFDNANKLGDVSKQYTEASGILKETEYLPNEIGRAHV